MAGLHENRSREVGGLPRACRRALSLGLVALLAGACAKQGSKAVAIKDGRALLEGRLEVLAQQPPPPPMCPEELAPFDGLLEKFVAEQEVPGAQLAVVRGSRLVCAKAYGLADVQQRLPVGTNSRFRIASISKPITATAVLKLVEQDRLRLDDRVYDLLDLGSLVKRKSDVDPRLKRVTVLQLLRHAGGFDREESFDPMFASKKIAKALKIKSPPKQWDIIRYMAGRPLDFDPGTRFAYSNFGYCLLGRIIEKVTGESYEDWVSENVLAPIGITGARLGRTLPDQRLPREVRYYDGRGKTAAAVVGKVGKKVPRPYGLWYLEAMDAHGGWVLSAVDLARFSAAFADHQASPLLRPESLELMFSPPPFAKRDAAGNPKGVFYGCGWRIKPKGEGRMNSWHSGNLEGTSTKLVRRHDGTSWVVLFNTDRNQDGKPLTKLIDSALHRAATKVEHWPERDLFQYFD